MNSEHIRYIRNQIYAARRELERKLDLLDDDMLKLQAECKHLNRAHRDSCPDCDKEFLEPEVEGS